MAPTILLDGNGRVELVAGSPGGSTIITSVFQSISNVIDHDMTLGQALVAPRVHHQHLPDRIDYEPGGLSPAVVAELEAMGHSVREDTGLAGDVQAILRLPNGSLAGQSDPRRGGVPAGY